MAHLVDMHMEDIQPGNLVYPSSSARESGCGNYMMSGIGPDRFVKDSDLFPALVIEPREGTLLTPTGVKSIGKYSLVSVVK